MPKKNKSKKSKKASKVSRRAPRRSPASKSRRTAKAASRRKKVARSPKRKVARKAPRAAPRKKVAPKKAAPQKAAPRKAAPKAGRQASSARPIAKPKAVKQAAPQPKRLAASKRHAVESDERRERVGDADDEAFVGTDTQVDEAKELGEEFVRTVTSGEEAESEMEEEEAVEEEGGPFVVTSASTEYAFGTDESNPADAEKAPFPQVSPSVSPKTDGEDEDQ
jgi:hypothetical protein